MRSQHHEQPLWLPLVIVMSQTTVSHTKSGCQVHGHRQPCPSRPKLSCPSATATHIAPAAPWHPATGKGMPSPPPKITPTTRTSGTQTQPHAATPGSPKLLPPDVQVYFTSALVSQLDVFGGTQTSTLSLSLLRIFSLPLSQVTVLECTKPFCNRTGN